MRDQAETKRTAAAVAERGFKPPASNPTKFQLLTARVATRRRGGTGGTILADYGPS